MPHCLPCCFVRVVIVRDTTPSVSRLDRKLLQVFTVLDKWLSVESDTRWGLLAEASFAGGGAAGCHYLGELHAWEHRARLQNIQGQGLLRRRAAPGRQPDHQLCTLPGAAFAAKGAPAE